ncbi:alcohol dehydrogenase class IV [Aminobacter lissarensis]|uniref:Alcohol dehydrogenase class IV n=1 Tax=Aminobacter carboxidus TaxID=376165 RepID=A0A8E2BF72_9HYPH|nr:maleylacetate reductase [Aminobacter lissarensis]MBB6469104.1 alcohol dehydrogenase class IV [Aminobacter lissarensis]
MQPFNYDVPATRVVFGFGTSSKLKEEMDRLCVSRALILSTPEQVEQAAKITKHLGDSKVGLFSGAAMHTPVHVTDAAMVEVDQSRADVVVAVGGGSTTGLCKAIALRTDLPQIVIPTTYAGSEMTPILGETKDNVKTTQRSPKVLPEVVIYDVELTLSLPLRASVTSGLNAVAHAVEALYARDGNPIIALMAEEGIRAFAEALPALHADATDRSARSRALYGAWLCGMCLGNAGMALHHKLCHTLGGTFDLPHAETHTVILPHALAYNAPVAKEAESRIARALGADEAAVGLYELARSLGAPLSLRELGFDQSGIERAVEIAMKNPYWNPRELTAPGIRGLLQRAWNGDKPAP